MGADLARRSSAALALLHVLDPLPYALPGWGELFSPEDYTRLKAETHKALAALRLRAETAGAAQPCQRNTAAAA
jgi:nucleotide-binding universal stress UspA family protein